MINWVKIINKQFTKVEKLANEYINAQLQLVSREM